MRFLLCILIWIFFVGGLWAYTAQRDASLPKGTAPVADRDVLTGEYVLEITPGFSIDKDPFALSLDDAPQSPGLEVRLNGQALTVGSGEISRGKVIRITEGLTPTAGFNEFYVQASPPMSETHLDHGLKIRFLDRGSPVIDQTVWGSRGALVAGTVSFSLTAHKEDNHDH
ncbi:hypothetical protein [uncultured Desulfobacter sp.]|uniref:hypothetical protein n=1 Tax=uncultured Desulfobacter sp. TaxID=240139 RepID=UPI002AAAB64D|nr:hypothetical protein [uncultured Desulfobacter sp.]